jgi:hypothetical protein
VCDFVLGGWRFWGGFWEWLRFLIIPLLFFTFNNKDICISKIGCMDAAVRVPNIQVLYSTLLQSTTSMPS